MPTRRTRAIAPRLANGDSRLTVFLNVPEPVKEGLRSIARLERQSISWVLEQAILDYFHLVAPHYRKRAPQ